MPVDHTRHRPLFAFTYKTLLRAEEHQPDSLAGWFPALCSDTPPGLWWRYLGEQAFDEPFFIDTLTSQPPDQRLCCFTHFAALEQFCENIPLSALVFHISRCGSTLLTQMLATLPQCVALSEPPIIDSLLYHYQQGILDRLHCISLLRGVARALGQRRSAQQQHLVIKLDCWHLQHLDVLREAFPEVPALFLYRQPLQVVASHQRQRGPQMLPSMLDPDWVKAPDDLLPGDLDVYCLHVLNRFMQTALTAAHNGQLIPVNYNRLPDVVPDRLLPLLGIALSEEQRTEMLARTRQHAKHSTPFTGDPPPARQWGQAPDTDLHQRSQALYEALKAVEQA